MTKTTASAYADEQQIQLHRPDAGAALIVVDVQNGFTPGGNLAVNDGDKIIPLINRLAAVFDNIIITQDWHPAGHISFAGSHPGKQPFETIETHYGPQVLWPAHCVQGSRDAALHSDLHLPGAQLIIRKGYHKDIDSYSAFEEADHKTPTGLSGYLTERGITTVYITGLATDFCVAWTAMDARKYGFNAWVIEDATKGIDINGSLAAAWQAMESKGVRRIASGSLLGA
ncbi:bifunctional nicotinamidase/pyrazinamidase [Affinibrenneria salicis]|uniref:Nicotinamidase n=1 Tax=Affinibrenneria salicis TaxID=2590031 RepID=A0A5J5FQI0_9GAMM|nr:bifunctional nicotinamidase/pyrazinamidase [Affinibrenneria salicis]KAA8995235.1 bifunctional nicotinamidase/pyrazinamidase [Affinibrenneria salicis]